MPVAINTAESLQSHETDPLNTALGITKREGQLLRQPTKGGSQGRFNRDKKTPIIPSFSTRPKRAAHHRPALKTTTGIRKPRFPSD
jgi:hypothetical protein